MGWLGGKGHAGWVKAPPMVEQEIRAVWQEDEMPDEIRQAPGYHAFTLGTDSQDWVDSMAEVVDGSGAVFGRPKPVILPQHRSLTTSLPSQPPSASPPPSRPSTPCRSGASLPDLMATQGGAQGHPGLEAPTTHTSHILMPDIEESPGHAAPPGSAATPHVLMPDIEGAGASTRDTRAHDGSGAPAVSPASMPDIGASAGSLARPRTLPRRILVPEIGEDFDAPSSFHEAGAKSAMPDIGGDQEESRANLRRPQMPEIG